MSKLFLYDEKNLFILKKKCFTDHVNINIPIATTFIIRNVTTSNNNNYCDNNNHNKMRMLLVLSD